MTWLRYHLARWRLRRLLRRQDEAIARARAAHEPVRHLTASKTERLHQALRRAA